MFFDQPDETTIRWIMQLQDKKRENLALQTRALAAEQALAEKNRLLKEERKARESAEQKIEAAHKKAEEGFFDVITGLRNNQAFKGYAEIVHASAIRNGIPLTILFVDANGLKEVNDTLGHKAGNAYLKRFGEVFSAGRRDTDGLFRIGGDEFVIVLPGCQEPEEGARIGQQLLIGLRDNPCRFETDNGVVERVPGASIGVATLNVKNKETMEALLERGDKVMYLGKQAGKQATPRESLVSYRNGNGEVIMLGTPPKVDAPPFAPKMIVMPEPARPAYANPAHLEAGALPNTTPLRKPALALVAA